MLIVLFFLVAPGMAVSPDLGYYCDETENRGIKYYMDIERQEVYPYYFAGCQLNERERGSYEMYDHSWQVPGRIPDIYTCPGFNAASVALCFAWDFGRGSHKYPILKSQKREDFPDVRDKCLEGSSCQSAHMGIGQCCDTAIGDRYRENRKAICKENETSVPDMFGRLCEHNFCPYGTRCQQGEFEAYCCAPDK